MIALYADTSAIVRAYLADEPDHDDLRSLLFEKDHLVLTSELTRVEFASAVTAAMRFGRILDSAPVLRQFDHDTLPGNPLKVIPFDPRPIMTAARRLVMDNVPVRTLDAMHLAVALHSTADLTGGAEVTMVTRDSRQADAARANGLSVL